MKPTQAPLGPQAQPLELFGPNAPFGGLETFPNNVENFDGKWDGATNVRTDDGTIRTRDQLQQVSAAPSGWTSSWEPRGLVELTANGNLLMLQAYYDNSANCVKVFNTTSEGVITEITDATTRITGSASSQYWLWACSFPDTIARKDYVLFGTGGDQPRVWNASAPSGVESQIVRSVAAPKASNRQRVQANWPEAFLVSTAANSTFSSSGANFSGADAGSGTDLYHTWTRNTTVDANCTATVAMSTTKSGANARQFCLICRTTSYTWWDNVKLEIMVGGTGYTVHDPSSAQYRPVFVPIEGGSGQYSVVAFSIDHITASLASCSGWRMTWVGSAPTATQTLDVLVAAFSGKVPGGTQYALSYLNSKTRCESPGMVYAPAVGALFSEVGGGSFRKYRIPVSPLLFFSYTVYYQDPTTTENGYGVDKLRLYRADGGLDTAGRFILEEDFSYVAQLDFGSALAIQNTVDNLDSTSKRYDLFAPSAYCTSLPPCLSAICANNRVVALGLKSGSDTSGRFNIRWFSEYGNPMRMSEILGSGVVFRQTDDSSGQAELVGDSGRGLIALATSDLGIQTIATFGNENVYTSAGRSAFDLASPKVASPHGCPQPLTICTYQNEVFWVDKFGQVRRGSPSNSTPISRFRVEDQIVNYNPSNLYASAATVHGGRFYLSFSEGVASIPIKSSWLVYNLDMDMWESLDSTSVSGVTMERPINFSRLLYFQSKDGRIVRLGGSANGQDFSTTDITSTLSTPYLVLNGFEAYNVDRFDVACDDQDSKTMTLSVYGYPEGTATKTATANLGTTGSGNAWKAGNFAQGNVTIPARGWAQSLRFSWATTSGKRIYRLRTMVTPRERTAKAVA